MKNFFFLSHGTTMHSKSMRFFLVLATAFAAVVVQAQTINIYGINASAFPKIVADYVALDAAGNPITDLTEKDFTVVETPQGLGAQDLTATVKHSCVEQNKDPEASIIFILDRSNSMRDVVPGANRQRWDIVKDAVRAFVNQLRFVGQTRVSLVSFAGTYEVINEWVDNKQPILDSLKDLKIQTVTNYVLPFDSPGNNIYELFKRRPANIPKFVFFLTDGTPNPGIPNETKFVNDNTQLMQAQGIRFFAITIKEESTHWTLDALARATGGKSILTNEARLLDILSLLALETQVTKTCQITWTSPYACAEQALSRVARITLKRGSNPTAAIPYQAPANALAKVEVSDPILFCGDPAPNGKSYANFTLTALNAPFSVTTAPVPSPATYFKVVDWNFPLNQATFAPFNLAPNGKRVIRVEFTQGNMQSFRQAQLAFTGTPCPPSVTLVGGTGVILLQSPIGGELFSTCDTVSIKWAGVLPSQQVAIDYSTNGGTNWTNITNTATGLVYKWLPPAAGVNYRVRVSVSPVPQYVWAKQLGGAGAETATSVAVTPNGLKVFATGYFDGPSKFGTTIVNNQAGNIDGYFTEFDSDGNITNTMLLTGSASNDERVIGAVTDKDGNVYVAGYFSSQAASFGGFPLSPGPLDTRNMFVYKFAPDGSLQWANISKGSGTSSSEADCSDIGIRYDASGNPEIIIVGRFRKYIEVGISRGGTIERNGPYTGTAAQTWRNYYVIYDTGGYPRLTANAAAPTAGGIVYKSKTVKDALNFTYATDSYTGPKSFTPPPITLPNSGLTDVFVTKNGASPASNDVSKSNFSVLAPQLTVAQNKVVFKNTPQGQSEPVSLTSIIQNKGSFPVTIQRINIAGTNAGDFRVISPTVFPIRLDTGRTLSLELAFEPKGTGLRTAILEVIGNCNANTQVILEGTGLAPCVWDSQSSVQLGKVPLGQPASRTVTCVLKNTGPLPLNGRLTVTKPDPDITVKKQGAFTLAANGGCFDLELDIAAASPGTKTCTVDFGLAADCGSAVSTITVEIVEPRVAIDSVNFGRVRLLTPVAGNITITNLNTDPASITGYSISDPTNPNFSGITLPAPQVLAPGASIKIPVTYTPQTRGAHSITINATVQGQNTPLVGLVSGVGFQPVLDATGYTFKAWPISTTSPEQGKVVLRNTDTDAALTINNVAFQNATTVFAWTGTTPTFPQTIAPGGTLELTVSFTPAVVGNNAVNVCIEHDGKPGPGPVPPYTTTCVEVKGIGLDQSGIPPINFENTLTCATRVDSFEIINPSQFPLNVQAPVGSGDAAAFQLSETAAFIVAPGATKVVTVTFRPTSVQAYAASFSFANDQNLKLNVSLSGNGVATPVNFRYGTIAQAQAGQVTATPINVSFNAGEFAGAAPTQFDITITHDAEAMAFAGFAQPEMAGWTFTPTTGVGSVAIRAQSVTGVLTQGPFVTPTFNTYLNADSTLPMSMTVTTPLSCLVTSGDATKVTMKFVCFTTGRLVKFGNQQFGLMNPRNNPVRDELVVPYTTGITVATTFQIADAMGNVVIEATGAVAPSGSYIFEANTSTLASGVYFLRMQSGPFVASTQFVVVK